VGTCCHISPASCARMLRLRLRTGRAPSASASSNSGAARLPPLGCCPFGRGAASALRGSCAGLSSRLPPPAAAAGAAAAPVGRGGAAAVLPACGDGHSELRAMKLDVDVALMH